MHDWFVLTEYYFARENENNIPTLLVSLAQLRVVPHSVRWACSVGIVPYFLSWSFGV